MSDGNYNRNLLPYRDYQSGVRAGRAQTRAQAFDTLKAILEECTFSSNEREEILARFRCLMP
ncbi:MAG: hypothetical protein IJS89_08760 [Bacteroidaceae bacterium]|nr:hypothetical protein [Bacteroidaceae bacterium]